MAVQALAISAFVSTLALALGLGLNNGLGGAMVTPAVIALVVAFVGMAIGKALRRLSVAAFRRWDLKSGVTAPRCRPRDERWKKSFMEFPNARK
jgi:hypothetical protein